MKMVSLKIMIALCAGAISIDLTAAEVLPINDIAYPQALVANGLPTSVAVLYTAPFDPSHGPPGPVEERSYSAVGAEAQPTTTTLEPSTTPVIVPAVTPCQAIMKEITPVTSVQTPTTLTVLPVTTAPVATTAPTPTTKTELSTANATADQPIPSTSPSTNLTEPTTTPTAIAATEAPVATAPALLADARPAPVTTETPTMAPVALAVPPSVNKTTNGTKIGGVGRLKLGWNVTVDRDGNVFVGVKSKFKGNGTVVTKTGNAYNAGGQFEGAADVDTGINIGPMPNGGTNYTGGLDVGGDFEVEKPSPSATSETTLPSSEVRAESNLPSTPPLAETLAATPGPALQPLDTNVSTVSGQDGSPRVEGDTNTIATSSAL